MLSSLQNELLKNFMKIMLINFFFLRKSTSGSILEDELKCGKSLGRLSTQELWKHLDKTFDT